MKLLLVTQIVDREDPVLGFFHEWIVALADHFEGIEVVCLKEGKHNLPANVRVHSLGKEHGTRTRIAYGLDFLKLAWNLKDNYDRVFVHMNQEYILIAGVLWRCLGKQIYLWRNHYAGSFFTDIAAAFCKHVFCTSTHSYTARYHKTIIMPVGVDLARFANGATAKKKPRSVLFLARMAPSKQPDMLLEALGILQKKGIKFTASFVGSPLPNDQDFYEALTLRAQELGLYNTVTFMAGVAPSESPTIFGVYEIFVNTSPNGMLDKTIFEAAASGSIVLAQSADFRMYTHSDLSFDSIEELVYKLEHVLAEPKKEKQKQRELLAILAERNSISRLIRKLSGVLTS